MTVTTTMDFPYRRDLRPSSPASLGEHIDREYGKIEAAMAEVHRENGLITNPKATATPVDNGELRFELTSNTLLKIKVKGSDGTVRSVSLTLV